MSADEQNAQDQGLSEQQAEWESSIGLPIGNEVELPDSRQLRLPDGQNPHLAIWGTQGSGKTVYLATLFEAFLGSKNNDELPNWTLMPRSRQFNGTDDWHKIYTDMVSSCVFPDATQAGVHHFPEFALKDENDALLFNFTFIDAPGEMYRDPDTYTKKYRLNIHPYQYLKRCQGILLLLDPVQALYGRDDAFTPVTEMLIHLSQDANGNPAVIDTPVALCITKCDHPDCRSAIDDAPGFAKETFGRRLIDVIDSFLRNAKWFASSALGFNPNDSDRTQSMNMIRRWDGSIGIRDPKQINPINIAQPLVWLKEQMTSNVGGAQNQNAGTKI